MPRVNKPLYAEGEILSSVRVRLSEDERPSGKVESSRWRGESFVDGEPQHLRSGPLVPQGRPASTSAECAEQAALLKAHRRGGADGVSAGGGMDIV